MKKVLIICEKLADERTGGIQTRVINYSRNLPKFNISPTILSIAKYKNNSEIKKHNSNIHRYNKKNLLQILRFANKNKNKYNIFHFLEGINNLQHFLLFLFFWLLRKKPIVSLYGGEMYDIQKSNKLNSKLKIKIIQQLAHKIIVNSKATRHFVPKGFRNKTFIVNPGVNSDYLQYLDKFSKDESSFNLFFAGRLIRRKGLDDVIKALNIVKKNHKNIKLQVAGEGPNLETYKKLASDLKVSDEIEFMGDVKDISKMAKLYKSCDVFIMPPKLVANPPGGYESFGCVYLEANLFKKPAIGTKHFGVQEAIEDGKTGILVDENSPQKIANAIFKLIKSPNLKNKLGEYGHDRTKNYYMDINSTEQLAKVYL